MKLTLVSVYGEAPPQAASADFMSADGTIGRDPNCTLVLADPHKHVSREHARVERRGLSYAIVSTGQALPISVDGIELGRGEETELRPGAEIVIGGFVLTASASTREAAPSRSSSTAATVPFGTPAANGSSGGSVTEILGDLTGSDEFVRTYPAPHPGTPADPAAGPRPSAQISTPVSASASASTTDSALAKILEMLLSGTPAGDSMENRLRQSIERGNDTPIVHTPIIIGTDRPAPSGEAPSGPDIDVSGILDEILGSDRQADRFEPGPTTRPTDIIKEKNAGALNRAGAGAAGVDPLIEALAQGAGIELKGLPSEMSPQYVHRLGVLLARFTDAVVTLMMQRQQARAELGTAKTMVQPFGNNALKHAPRGRYALPLLLAEQPQAGYLSPEASVDEAVDDLVAHHVAFVCALNASVKAVLEAFEPEHIERALTERGLLAQFVPGARRARLWDTYTEQYAELRRRATEDFAAAFGEAMRTAYLAELAAARNRRA